MIEMNTSNDATRAKRPASATALGLVLVFLAGAVTDRYVFTRTSGARTAVDYRLVAQAAGIIKNYYVARSDLKPRQLTYGAINGMMDALGDTGHSTFLTPEMVKQVKAETKGQLKGIGVEIQMKEGHVVVVAPIDNSPAQRAGLRPGDIILKVAGQEITGWPVTEVVEKITGPPGTRVALTVLDPRNGHTRDLTIERASLRIEPLTWQLLPGTHIAHLRISAFDEGLTKSLRKVLTELQKQRLAGTLASPPIEGAILDLRNNPGGLLTEAVGVASQFLTEGSVVLIQNGQGKVVSIPVEKGGLAPRLPLVVLINDGSASGAEIVAGALKDAKRADLVGETTFGTGTVLTQFQLADGSALLLAIEEWLTPNGQSFWHKGIAPQTKVTLPPEAAPLMPATERELTSTDLKSSGDAQLLRALDILTGATGRN